MPQSFNFIEICLTCLVKLLCVHTQIWLTFCSDNSALWEFCPQTATKAESALLKSDMAQIIPITSTKARKSAKILHFKGTVSPDYKCLKVISFKSPLLGHVTPDI